MYSFQVDLQCLLTGILVVSINKRSIMWCHCGVFHCIMGFIPTCIPFHIVKLGFTGVYN